MSQVGSNVVKASLKETLKKLNLGGWAMAVFFLGLPILDILRRLSLQRKEWDKQLAAAKKTCRSYPDFEQRQVCLHKAMETWAKNMVRAYQQEVALLKQAYGKCPADKKSAKKHLWKQLQKHEKKLAYYKRLASALANPNSSVSGAFDYAKNP